jgi:hypothetical protein
MTGFIVRRYDLKARDAMGKLYVELLNTKIKKPLFRFFS